MSANRPSNGVRNLRAMFENQGAASPETRGRSPNGHLSSADQERPLSKVRSSFVAIDKPSGTVQIEPDTAEAEHNGRSSTASLRRENFSFNETDNKDDLETLRKTVSEEKEARRESVIISETVPEAAVETTPLSGTPAVESREFMAAGENKTARSEKEGEDVDGVANKLNAMTLPSQDIPASNPDKPVSAAEEEPGQMRNADPKRNVAVPGTEAEPSAPAEAHQEKETQKSPAKTPAKKSPFAKPSVTPSGASAGKTPSSPKASRSAHKPSAISTGQSASGTPFSAAPKTPSSVTRPTTSGTQSSSTPSKHSATPSKPTSTPSKKLSTPSKKTSTPQQNTSTSPRDVMRKASRVSLTASTAASAAKAKSHPEPAAGHSLSAKSKSSTSSKPQPRSPTQPVKVSSHLTAPTASFAAKHESQVKTTSAPTSSKSVGHGPPRASTSSAKSATASTRSSLARAGSTATKPISRPSISRPAAANEGFLARMSRPTASSASKAHDKVEPKPAPQKAASTAKPRVNGHSKVKIAKQDRPGSEPATAEASTAKDLGGSGGEDHPEETNGQEASKDGLQEDPLEAETSTPDKREEGGANESLADTPGFDAATIR